jgi:hypothetical protein
MKSGRSALADRRRGCTSGSETITRRLDCLEWMVTQDKEQEQDHG